MNPSLSTPGHNLETVIAKLNELASEEFARITPVTTISEIAEKAITLAGSLNLKPLGRQQKHMINHCLSILSSGLSGGSLEASNALYELRSVTAYYCSVLRKAIGKYDAASA